MGVGRDLLEQVALAGSPRAKFDEVVVPLDEGDHAQEHDALRPLVEGGWLQADGPQQEVDPLGAC